MLYIVHSVVKQRSEDRPVSDLGEVSVGLGEEDPRCGLTVLTGPPTGLMGTAKLKGAAGDGVQNRRLARSSATRSGSGLSESSESLSLR